MVRLTFGLTFGLALVGLASGGPVSNKSAVLGADCVADWGKCGGKAYDGITQNNFHCLPTSLCSSVCQVGLIVR